MLRDSFPQFLPRLHQGVDLSFLHGNFQIYCQIILVFLLQQGQAAAVAERMAGFKFRKI